MNKSSHPHSVELASNLNSRLRLNEIALSQVSAKVVDFVDNARLACSRSLAPVKWGVADSVVFASYTVKVAIQHREEGDEAPTTLLAVLKVQYTVDYVAVDGLDPNDESLPHFLGIVGWMNVWPYVRSEVQSLTCKLGFPALTLPLMLTGATKDVPVVRMAEAEAVEIDDA